MKMIKSKISKIIAASLLLANLSACKNQILELKEDISPSSRAVTTTNYNSVMRIKVTNTVNTDDRVQFVLKNVSIKKGDEISFKIKPNIKDAEIIVRNGEGSYSKWTSQKTKLSGSWDGYYEVKAKATENTSSLAVAIMGKPSLNDRIYLDDVKIGSNSTITFLNYSDSSIKNWAPLFTPSELDFWVYNESTDGVKDPATSEATIKKIELITTGPGEDCSTSMTVAWNSPYPESYIEYYPENNSSNKKTIHVSSSLNKTEWYAKDKFYPCKVILSDLIPDTKYCYTISTQYEKSSVYKFKTAASSSTNFNFLVLSDLHTPRTESAYKNLEKYIENAKTNFKSPEFIMFTGDMVNKGNVYEHWQALDKIDSLKKYMYAFTPGNHDYKKMDSGSTTYNNTWFNDFAAFPENYSLNGVTLPSSNYYYIYNRVLFVMIDSESRSAQDKAYDTDVKTQIKWFENVMSKVDKSSYDYIIFANHRGMLVNGESKYGNYEDWYPYFDKYKVDFVLGGDDHEYSRSKVLYNNQVTDSKSKGTVYITEPQTEGSYSTIKLKSSINSKCAAYGGGCNGALLFTVTNDTIKMQLIDSSSKAVDSVTVYKKDRGSSNKTISGAKWSGLRFSLYGVRKDEANNNKKYSAPTSSEWKNYLKMMENKLPGSKGTVILIVSSIKEDGWVCSFHFPKPSNVPSGLNVKFEKEEDTYNYEELLTMCDKQNYDVWLQVEPGNNDVCELAKIVLNKYKHHPSVKGFGIDCEWYHPENKGSASRGYPLDDSTAKKLVKTAREINSSYTVFAKHWDSEYMPQSYRDGMIFVNDSQGFHGSFEDMKDEFKDWAKLYKDNPVIFQIGYVADKDIWGNDPFKTAQGIVDATIPYNKNVGIIWVDFTMHTALDKYL